jgi:hypothetical protein
MSNQALQTTNDDQGLTTKQAETLRTGLADAMRQNTRAAYRNDVEHALTWITDENLPYAPA